MKTKIATIIGTSGVLVALGGLVLVIYSVVAQVDYTEAAAAVMWIGTLMFLAAVVIGGEE